MAKETLYLVPGWLCDRQLFRFQLTRLGAAFDVRVPDDRDYDTIEAMADAILADAPERFSIAGHSLGGRVALEVYRKAPERVSRIALLDTATTPGSQNERIARAAMLKKALAQGTAVIAKEVLMPSMHPAHRGDRTIGSVLLEMVTHLQPHILAKQFNAMVTRPDSAAVLASITCPALVLFARDDRNLPFDRHGEIAARIPSARLVIVDECGHLSPLEQPKVVLNALEAWMATPVGRAQAQTADI